MDYTLTDKEKRHRDANLLTDHEAFVREMFGSIRPNLVIVNTRPARWRVLDSVSSSIFNYFPVKAWGAPAPNVYCISAPKERLGDDRVGGASCWASDVGQFTAHTLVAAEARTSVHPLSIATELCAAIRYIDQGYSYPPYPRFVRPAGQREEAPPVHAALFFIDDLTERTVSSSLLDSAVHAFLDMGSRGVKPFVFLPVEKDTQWNGALWEVLGRGVETAGGGLSFFGAQDVGVLRECLTVVTLNATRVPFLIKGMVKGGHVRSVEAIRMATRLTHPYEDMDFSL